MSPRTALMTSVLMLALASAPSAVDASGKAGPGKTLYDRLGGRETVAAILDDFVARVGADEGLKGRFGEADLAGMKERMADQICQLAGGPCTYSGRTMAEAHAGKGITNDEFMAFVGDLAASMEKLGVASKDSGTLVGKLLSMKKDIVEKP